MFGAKTVAFVTMLLKPSILCVSAGQYLAHKSTSNHNSSLQSTAIVSTEHELVLVNEFQLPDHHVGCAHELLANSEPLRALDVLCSFCDDEQIVRRRANHGDDAPVEVCMVLESDQEEAFAQSKAHARVHSQKPRPYPNRAEPSFQNISDPINLSRLGSLLNPVHEVLQGLPRSVQHCHNDVDERLVFDCLQGAGPPLAPFDSVRLHCLHSKLCQPVSINVAVTEPHPLLFLGCDTSLGLRVLR